MPNNVVNADIIAKEAALILENELGILKRMHRAYEDEFTQKVNGYEVGDTISIRRPADFTVRTGPVIQTQDVIEGKIPLTVNIQKGVDFEFTSVELTLNISDLSERVIRPAMINLVNDIAADVLTEMYRGVYNWVGTPGQRIDSFNDFALGPERLDEMAVPTAQRAAVLSPHDHWGMLGSQTALFIADAARGAYRAAELGEIGGVDTLMSQVVPTHVVGPLGGTPLVKGANQSVTFASVKDTWYQDLETDGWTAAAALRLRKGDVFTIAGVNMVNPKTKADTGIPQQFVVLQDTSSDASGNATVRISPPIIASGPHQTVAAAPADNAPITVMGTSGTGYKQNMFFHKNAMALAMVPMIMPPAVVNGARQTYKSVSVRVIPIYDGTNDVSKWRLDVLYGRKLIQPWLATRASGSA